MVNILGWNQIMSKYALALALTFLMIPKTVEANEVLQRFSLEIGAGSLIAYSHARVAYRLPDIAANRVGVFLDASLFEVALGAGSSTNIVTAGARYYLDNWGAISPYTFAGVSGFISTSRGLNGATAGEMSFMGPLVIGGIGADWMWTPHVGLNTQLGVLGGTMNGQTSILPRFEVNLKLSI